MSEIIKACVYCQHCDYEEAVDYGGETGFNPASWRCGRSHFNSKDSFADMVDGDLYLKAQECGDFKLNSKITKAIENKKAIGAAVEDYKAFLKSEYNLKSVETELAFNEDEEYTEFKTSVVFDDGSEWHEVARRTGGDFRTAFSAIEIFIASSKVVLERKVVS